MKNGLSPLSLGSSLEDIAKLTVLSPGGLIPLTDATGKLITRNGIGLYANSTSDLAAYLGIDTFEAVIQPETYCTPTEEFGDQLLVGNALFKRVRAGNGIVDSWVYAPGKKLNLFAENVSVTNVNNSSTADKTLGSIKVPGDALRWSKNSTISITITADGDLAGSTLALGFSDIRVNSAYRVKKVLTSGNTATLELLVTPLFSTKLKLEQISSNTAPTYYPYNSTSQIVDINLLGNVVLPIIFSFGAAQNPATISLLSVTTSLKLSPPETFKYDPAKTYRKAYEQPFTSDDMWNLPLTDRVVTGRIGFPLDWATTGSATSGTINASGTAGSDLVYVVDSSKCRVGEYVVFADTYGTAESVGSSASILNAATITALGYAPKIIAIPDATHIQLDRPSLTTWTRRGIESWGAIHFLASFSSAETLMARSGATSGDMTNNPITGVAKGGTKAIGYFDKIPVLRIQATDPISEWKMGKVVAFNGWIFSILAGTGQETGGEALLNGTYFMKTPAVLNDGYIHPTNGYNADKNLVLITEDGRYAIEHIWAAKNATTGKFTTSRSVVVDLYGKSTSYLLDRPEFVNTGISDSTRAASCTLIGGLIRAHELAACPDSSITGESAETIAANIAKAMSAIPHAIVMVMAFGQVKSNNYCPDPAVQGTKVALKAYKSQLNNWKPAISAAGTGYALGDVLYVVGGDYFVPMRLTVTGINGSGGVTDIFVTQTGQYKTLPSDGTALVTTSSGAGTGCVLNVLAIPTAPTQLTLADAFPDINVSSLLTYPAPAIDSGWASYYGGTVPMGALFTIPNSDLAASWTTKRTTSPTAKSSSYEYLALLAAVQKYGAYVTDIASDTHLIAVVERNVDSVRYANMHGDVGSYTYPHLTSLKSSLLYVENSAPQGKGVAGNLRAPLAAELYPINN